MNRYFSLLMISIMLIACQNNSEKETMKIPEDNVLLQDWKGDYGGVPAFDKMKLDQLEEAMKIGMELHLEELDSIAEQEEEPSFENTIVAMQSSGDAIDRVFTYYGIWSSNLSRRNSGIFRENYLQKYQNTNPRSIKTPHYLNVSKPFIKKASLMN